MKRAIYQNISNILQAKIIWRAMCKNHTLSGCLQKQLESPNLRMIYLPDKRGAEYLECFENYFNTDECMQLMKNLLVENSSTQLFLHLSKDEDIKTKRFSITFSYEAQDSVDNVNIEHEMKCLELYSPGNNVWKPLMNHFPKRISEILQQQTLFESQLDREIIEDLQSKLGSIFHTIIRAKHFWDIFNQSFYSRYSVSLFV